MKLGIIIPWREKPSRLEPFNYVVNWYKERFPDAEFIFVDAPGEFWQPSASRNMGVRRAQEAHCDLLIVGDADSIPEINALNEALEQAPIDGMIHNPYRVYKHLTFDSTQNYYRGMRVEDCQGSLHHDAVGGIWVCTPEAWWELGGMDEKFLQWGPEDRAFDVVHQMVKGVTFIKHDGWLISLAHDRQELEPAFHKTHLYNTLLFKRYYETKTVEQMLELVSRVHLELIT